MALEKKLRIRGHTLVWGKASWMYKSPDLNGKLLWDVTKAHITKVLNHYRGKIQVWDAVNEPLATWGTGEFEDNVYTRYLGEEYVEKVFQLAPWKE